MGGCVSRQNEECDGAIDFDRAPMPQPLPQLPDSAELELHRGIEQQMNLFRQSNSSQQLCQSVSRPRSSNTTPVQLAIYPGNNNNNNNSSSSSRASSLKKLHQVSSNGLQQLAQCQQQQQSARIVAKFDYAARTEDEISFYAGDILYLINAIDTVWWYVEHRKSGACGYAPVDLLAKGNSLDSKSWFAGPLARKEAERLLLSMDNPCGTFMVRESSTMHASYSLSVLDKPPDGRDTVKHYRIRQLDGCAGFFITRSAQFTTMQALVEFYSVQSGGLCCRLTEPCPRQTPIVADLSYRTRGDMWEIPRSQIQLVDQLGTGQFGEVWKGLFNGSQKVAVKMLKAGSMSRSEFLKEARIMKQLRHPKLVQLFAVCTEGDPVFIITELMSGGALLNHLRDCGPNKLDMSALVDILGQVASGMQYLEAEKFIHRDLAARNILVGDRNCVKVADFGLSRAIGDYDGGEYMAQQGAKFPIKWTSPEAALLGRFTIKSDVWSFGIVIFEVVTHGQMPYAGMSNTETLREVENGYRMPQPQNCSDELYELMLNCWDKTPERRPTFAHLAQYFEDFFPSTESGYRNTAEIV